MSYAESIGFGSNLLEFFYSESLELDPQKSIIIYEALNCFILGINVILETVSLIWKKLNILGNMESIKSVLP